MKISCLVRAEAAFLRITMGLQPIDSIFGDHCVLPTQTAWHHSDVQPIAPCLLQHHSEHFWASRWKQAHLWLRADYLGSWEDFETRLTSDMRVCSWYLLFSLLPASTRTLLHDFTLILALLFLLLRSRVSLRDWHSHYTSQNDRDTNAAQSLRRKHLKTALKWRAALWTSTRDDSMLNTPPSMDIIFCQELMTVSIVSCVPRSF